ncbi:MAG: nicotinate-nucleotide--dimethylbenzimidazole phosphoribosyltransferase [Candidatus Omnitrophota bacterium]
MQSINEIIHQIGTLDKNAMEKAQKRLDSLTKPQGSLGRLEDLAKQISGMRGEIPAALKFKTIFTLAADHGVAQEGVSAFPQEVTAQMVINFLKGGAGINVLARHVGASVVVADVGVKEDIKTNSISLKVKKIGRGTKNMLKEPAMTSIEAVKSVNTGIELFEEEFPRGIDIVGTGEMGIANTTAASAITAAITKSKVEDVTGRGTGVDDKGLAKKIEIIKKALEMHNPDSKDALDVLAKVGGFEIGGLAGIMLAAASRRIPIVVDGFISGAAALIAYTLQPKIKDFMIAAHCSVEKGHKIILEHIGLKPVLDLQLRLGEGTGAALLMGVIDAAVKIINEMATFESASVSGQNK